MDAPTLPPDYGFHKDRLTRGWSYPLKRSLLDEALVSAGATNIAAVFYSLVMTPMDDRRAGPLTAHYHGDDTPSHWAEQVSIYVETVPSENRREIADALLTVLGDVARWIAGTTEREPTWRAASHSLYVFVDDGSATLREAAPAFRRRRT
jgi:hypothetical protein